MTCLEHVTLEVRLIHGCAVISQISRNYNGLEAVFQRMRKMREIATPLSRLAMPVKANCQDLVFSKCNIWIKLYLVRYYMVGDAQQLPSNHTHRFDMLATLCF